VGFHLKTLAEDGIEREVLRQDLDGHGASESDVEGPVHLPHSPST
jgi:hypothetical protein